MATDNSQFSNLAAAVGRDLLGDPNKQLTTKDQVRWGKQGSMSLDVAKGTFFDHSEKVGGGVLWLIERMTGQPIEGGKAVQWLRDNGYHVEDRAAPPPTANAQRYQTRFDPDGNVLPKRVPDHGRLTGTYDYCDADGRLCYQVARYDWYVEPKNPGDKDHEKTFVQRRPDSSKPDGWTFKVQGTTPLPYRLPELLQDIADGAEIFIVEGEKKVDMLRDLGVPATCNTGGGGKWPDEIVQWFKGAKCTILPDNDPTGESHVRVIASKMDGVAKRLRRLDLPGLPPKGGVDDWLPAGGSADELYRLASEHAVPVVAPVDFESKFDAVSWSDLDAPGPEHEWLIKKVLTRGEVSMLAGASQSGKTFLALDMSMAVCRGVPFFGHKALAGGVIYCASESARGVRRKRLKAYRQFHNVADQDLPFTLLQRPLNLYESDEHIDQLIEEAHMIARIYERRHGVGLEMIVIDTLSSVTPGWDENSSRDVGPVLERCQRLSAKTGAHVMLIHHLNADGTKARGHTSIFANIENVMIVKRVDGLKDKNDRPIREMTISKQKEAEDGATTRFVLHGIPIGRDEDGDTVTSCIVAPPAIEAGQEPERVGAIQVGGQNQKALRALYDVLSDILTYEPAAPEMALPAGTRVTLRTNWGQRFANIELSDDHKDLPPEELKRQQDAIRQAFKRAKDTLYTKGVIGLDEKRVWLTGKPVMGFPPPPGSRRHREESRKAEEEKRNPPPFVDDDADFDPSQL